MALRVAVYVTTLLLIAVVQIKKCTFCSADSFNLIANHAGPVYEIHDNDIFSSLWQNRKSSGILLRPTKSTVERLIGLLLICGDIETCPGPTIKCSSCAKTIRKNKSRIQCSQCNGKFHLKCFITDDSANTTNSCLFCLNDTMNGTHENIADVEPRRPPENQRELPELRELLSKRGFKILHQNIRGLLCHKHFVSELLDDFRNINLFALSETHTTPVENPQLQIPGYKCETKHRETGQGGGVAFYVSDNIPYHRRHDLESNDLECVWIEIIFPKTKGFLVGVIYKPPDSSKHLTENFEEKLNEMLATVMAENKECILLGDMNCNYLERSEHKEIKSIISNNGLKQLIKSPTRITNTSKTLIDVIYSNDPEKINSIKVIPADVSDHELLGCVRKVHSIKHSPRQIRCRNYTNYDPKLFCKDLESEDFSNVFDSRSTEVAWKHLKRILNYSINKHAPMITKKVKGRLCPWMTTKVKQEMNIRDKLLRKARRTNA
eukprot:Seg932.4 transcript_id=Seg932.4/GoldUCD/mRNA.D3Y31 product="hypothetical protein" protein_id=Seg932.4/GoldUCD/D3Y31